MTRFTKLSEDIILMILSYLDELEPYGQQTPVKRSLCSVALVDPVIARLSSHYIFRHIEVVLDTPKFDLLQRSLNANTERSRKLQSHIRILDVGWRHTDQEQKLNHLLRMAPCLRDLRLRGPDEQPANLEFLDLSMLNELRTTTLDVSLTFNDLINFAMLEKVNTIEIFQLGSLGFRSKNLPSCSRPVPLERLDTSGHSFSSRTLRDILELSKGTRNLVTAWPGTVNENPSRRDHLLSPVERGEDIPPHEISMALRPAQGSLEELKLHSWSGHTHRHDGRAVDLSCFHALRKVILPAECFFRQDERKEDLSPFLPRQIQDIEICFSLSSGINALNSSRPRIPPRDADTDWLMQLAYNKTEKFPHLKQVIVHEENKASGRCGTCKVACGVVPWDSSPDVHRAFQGKEISLKVTIRRWHAPKGYSNFARMISGFPMEYDENADW